MQGDGSNPQENPKLWVQLGEATRSTNLAILQTVQELKNEMACLREDHARLTVEQERILKSLSDRQNPPSSNPSAEQQRVTEEQDFQNAPKNSEDKEDHSDNVLQQQTQNVRKWSCRENSGRLNPRISMLQGKETLWWEEIKIVKGVSERTITWEKFQKYFKERYLTKRFYDEKAREFHDLRLGQQTMDEFINRFTSLLHYVPYIKEEKAKVQRFMSSLPAYIRERNEFDNPRTMDEAIRKARIFYQQNKQKGDASNKRWNEKKSSRMAGNSKGGRSNGSKGAGKGLNSRSVARGASRARPASESRITEQPVRPESEGVTRPPVQCWGCGGPHYVRNCPQRKGTDHISQIHEASTVGDVARSIPRINAALEDLQAEYQPSMVEFEATGAKRRVLAKINKCPLTIAGQPIVADLNILPLGSYDVLIGMDWMEKHWSLVNCKTKAIYYKDDHGEQQELQGIKHPVQIRPITASQLAKCIKKKCQIYAIQVGYANQKDKTAMLGNIPVVQEFVDVFPEEVPGLPPKRDVDFTIELIPGAAPVSRVPYRMTVPELTKLKMQLQELLDKNYIRPSVSPWGSPALFVKKKDRTFQMCIDYR
eukprot:PITA_32718